MNFNLPPIIEAKELWNSYSPFKNDAIKTKTKEKPPFKLLALKNLIDDDSKYQSLRSSVREMIDLQIQSNDLYKFKQSQDLLTGQWRIPKKKAKTHRNLNGAQQTSDDSNKIIKTQIIKDFVNGLSEVIRDYLSKVTNIELSKSNFDITTSRYDEGNYLLCHNDFIKNQQSGHRRALAFVFYLVERSWSSEDGGSLILFNSDDEFQPVSINNKLFIQPNTLVVFETSQKSWHSVEEVFSTSEPRLSINGWFHVDESIDGASLDKFEVYPYEFIKPKPLNTKVEEFLLEAINKDYMMTKTCRQVRHKFKEDSEINLINFLNANKYDEICNALKHASQDDKNLIQIGPYNKRNYKTISQESLPQVCKDLIALFSSELFFMMLSNLTGLDLQPPSLKESKNDKKDDHDLSSSSDTDSESLNDSMSDTEERPNKKQKLANDPLARIEFRLFEPGSYTLVHDYAFETREKSALDVTLHFNHDFKVDFNEGGYIYYMATNQDDCDENDDELLTVEPSSNSLSLVYRTEDTCRFVKYLTNKHKSNYQDLNCVFYESDRDLSDGTAKQSS